MKRILLIFALVISFGFVSAQFPFGQPSQPQQQSGGFGFGMPQQQGFGFGQQQGFGFPGQQGFGSQPFSQPSGFGMPFGQQQGFGSSMGFSQGQQGFMPPNPGYMGIPEGFGPSTIALPPQFPAGAPVDEMVAERMGQKVFERFGIQELMQMCNDEEKLVETVYEYVKTLQMPELCAPISEGLKGCEQAIDFCSNVGAPPEDEETEGNENRLTCPPNEENMKKMCISRNSEEMEQRTSEFDEDIPLQCELDWERNAGNFRRMCEQNKKWEEGGKCFAKNVDEGFRRDCEMRNGRVAERYDQFGCISGWDCHGGESFKREKQQNAMCGNNLCEYQENPDNCPNDCKLTGARCGDNFCDAGNNENSGSCRQDCLPNCGDGICANISCMSIGCPESENENNCPNDCAARPEPGAVCGNAMCESGEDYGNCASDCPAPSITETPPTEEQPVTTVEPTPETTTTETATTTTTTESSATETTATETRTTAESSTATTETATSTESAATTTTTTTPTETTASTETTATTSAKAHSTKYNVYFGGFDYSQPMAPQQPMRPQGFTQPFIPQGVNPGGTMVTPFGFGHSGETGDVQDFCNKDSFIGSCISRMKNEMMSSFGETNIDRICELEAKLNKNQMGRFCKQMENGKEDCRKHAEQGCKFISRQLEKCQENSSEEGIKKIIKEKAHEGCLFMKMQQSQFSGFGIPFMQPQAPALDMQIYNSISTLAQSENSLSGEYQPWLAGERSTLVDVAEDVGKAEANEKSKDIIYAITKFFGMQKDKELKEAKELKAQTEKLEKTIENLKALAEQMPDANTKSALEQSISGLEERMSELQAMAQSKEAGAAGIFSMFGG